jgi:prepilin-type N-terminal cleavage/methylation domain-containing protein
MAENLMSDRARASSLAGQRGFSMIEMLMTAFILAIGLLGLCMLQTMSLRANRGNSSVAIAVKVAEGVMDQVEQQGRLTWLNISDSTYTGLSAPVGNPNLIGIPLNGQLAAPLYFDNKGVQLVGASSGFITVNVFHPDDAGTSTGAGQLSDFNVVATFADTVTGSGAAVTRTVSLTRRIAHG